MISIAIDNGRHNTVGGCCYSAHHPVSKFAEHNIDMVSWVRRKCQTRAGVYGDVYKTLECVTKTDSKFPIRVLVWMTPKSTSINGVHDFWKEIKALDYYHLLLHNIIYDITIDLCSCAVFHMFHHMSLFLVMYNSLKSWSKWETRLLPLNAEAFP